MALVLDDRVKETSTTTGTGTLNLSGAVSGFQTFVAGIGDGNTTYYAIVNRDEAEWEVGLGTVTDASTDTLARTTVISSSNSDSAVNFSAGTKDIFCTLPASKVANLDTDNNLTIGAGSAGVDYTLTFDGADADGVLTWMEDEDYFKFSDDILINSTERLNFRDTALYIYSSTDGQLDLIADTEIQIAATTIDINGAVALNGAITGATDITLSGELDAATLDISGNADIDGTTNLDAVDIDGAVQLDATLTVGADDQGYDIKFFGDTASAYMLWDTSADDLVLAGAAGIDLAGDIDVDGTANLDIVDIDGAVQIDATFTSGVDGQGYDTKFFGDTSSAYMLWDTSADDLILSGSAGLIVPDGQFTLGSTAISSTAAEINLIDGGTARGTTAVASGDGILINDGGTMRMTNVDTVSTYFASHTVGGGNIVTTGALDSGSITSGFGTIDTGSSTITTTGLISGGSLDIDNVLINGTTIGHTDDTDLLTLADGALTALGTITVGVDDAGHDVKLFGNAAGAYMEWDASADELRIMGASADATTSTGKLLLATSLTDINANDVIGKIDFQAPHEAGGTDAITVAASIRAIAQATFSSSVNATDLIFYTGHSEAAAEKIRITSQNEIGIAGANYGTDGQVLTSGGAGAAVAWEDAAAGGISHDGSTADGVLTFKDSDEATVESNLTFNGSVLAVTGNVTTSGTVEPAGDVAAGDNAAIGYTSGEGLILIGQGSTNDITIKNDQDDPIIEVATGGSNIKITSGNLVMGTSGKGIDFGATAAGDNSSSASEILTDYEEGLWEHEVYDAITGGTEVAGYTQTYKGSYVKIGQLCHCNFWIHLSDKSNLTQTNTLWMRGLPFAPKNVVSNDNPGAGYWNNSSTNYVNLLPWLSRDNGAAMAFNEQESAGTTGSSANLHFDDIDDDFRFIGNITYKTAT